MTNSLSVIVNITLSRWLVCYCVFTCIFRDSTLCLLDRLQTWTSHLQNYKWYSSSFCYISSYFNIISSNLSLHCWRYFGTFIVITFQSNILILLWNSWFLILLEDKACENIWLQWKREQAIESGDFICNYYFSCYYWI